MTESAVTICDCIQIEIFICEIGFDDKAVLVNFIRIVDLNSSSSPIRVLLLNLFLIDGGSMRVSPFFPGLIDRTAAVVPISIV